MIKKMDFGKTKNITVVELGTGDVWMMGSVKGENGEIVLAFKTVKEPQPINVIQRSSVDNYDKMKPELVFIFNKVESIDSLINILKDCKTEMFCKQRKVH